MEINKSFTNTKEFHKIFSFKKKTHKSVYFLVPNKTENIFSECSWIRMGQRGARAHSRLILLGLRFIHGAWRNAGGQLRGQTNLRWQQLHL